MGSKNLGNWLILGIVSFGISVWSFFYPSIMYSSGGRQHRYAWIFDAIRDTAGPYAIPVVCFALFIFSSIMFARGWFRR